MTPSRTAAALLLATALLAGCGGEDEQAAPAPSPSAPAASPSAAASPAASPSAPAGPAQEPPVAGEEYVDRDGFAITFPEDWQLRQDVAGLQVAGTLPGQDGTAFADNVGVLLETTGRDGLTVEEYLDASVQNAPQQIKGFALVERDDVAGTLEFTGDIGQPLHFYVRVVVADGDAFTGTFTATEATFADGLPAAREVLDSLRTT